MAMAGTTVVLPMIASLYRSNSSYIQSFNEVKGLLRSTTVMILISWNHATVPTCPKRTHKLHKEAPIFIAVAWANKYDDSHIFMLFPEVFHAECTCDTKKVLHAGWTCDTNNTSNHLLTFSYRTSTGSCISKGLDSKSEEVCFPLGFLICTDQLI
jgi:hypothetical protein